MGNNEEQQGVGVVPGPCEGRFSLGKTSQTALERYKARRGLLDHQGDSVRKPRRSRKPSFPSRGKRISVLLGILFVASGVLGWRIWDCRPGDPIQLTYEVDLERAEFGDLTITLIAEGDLPSRLNLTSQPEVFGNDHGSLHILRPSAHSLNADGQMGKPLTVDRESDSFVVGTRGLDRVGFIYHVQLSYPRNDETDIRRHISTPVNGGVRFAGYEVFLEPIITEVDKITVTVRNPCGMPLLVPWPALVRGEDQAHGLHANRPPAEAHLGYGQGYRPANTPADATPVQRPTESAKDRAAPVPRNLFYHPRDLADLNNALLICGDLRTFSEQTRECVIQYATDRDWHFDDDDALELIQRIARTEIGFFGSSPTEQITVILSANQVQAPAGFDVYGVHTGSSVLVMLDPVSTWGMVEEQAASVIAHEMFHGWLGEAITQTDPTTLWFTEGATTWYAARMLTAAGIWTPAHARQVLADRLTSDYIHSPLRGQLSIAEAAADVMGEAGQVRFSYAGGVAACMALDQYLQKRTEKLRPLDQVLRYMYENRTAENLSRELLESAIMTVTGVDCHLWLREHVYGVAPLPPVERLI